MPPPLRGSLETHAAVENRAESRAMTRKQWLDVARDTTVPLGAWALATVTLLIVCSASGTSPWEARPWTWGDAALYLDIARHGYTLMPCGSHWCGNAGWLPAYPWLVGALHLIGVPLVLTAVGVAWVFHAATLVALWFTFLERRLSLGAVAALLLAAFFPGLVYHEVVFPLSLFAFCALLHLWFLSRGRWWASGFAGAAAVLSYPVGVVLPVSAAVWLLLARAPVRERLRRVVITSGLTAAGLAVLVVDQWLEVGRWNAYLLVQEKYHHHLMQPFSTFGEAVHTLEHQSPFALASATRVQTLLVTTMLACGIAAVAWRRPRQQIDLLVAIWATMSWLFSESQSHVQGYRVETALLPLALLVRRLPTAVVLIFTAIAIAVAIPLADLYFRGQLI
jgi:hypothetical protein